MYDILFYIYKGIMVIKDSVTFKLFFMARASRIVACPICGKKVRARGLKGHLKLKDHTDFLKMTQEGDLIVADLSSDSGDAEIKIPDSSRRSAKENIGPDKGLSAGEIKSSLIKHLEADLKSFTPAFFDYMKYFRNNQELAKREWKKITTLEEKYTWCKLINPEKYRALRRLFG